MYLTYQKYTEYGGELAQAAFNDYEFKAEGIVNHYTYNRLVNGSDVPEAVQRVVYQLIKIADKQDSALSLVGVISSRSNDGVSETRSGMSPDNIYQSLESQVKNIVLQGLSGVRDSQGHRLLYKGFYPNE